MLKDRMKTDVSLRELLMEGGLSMRFVLNECLV